MITFRRAVTDDFQAIADLDRVAWAGSRYADFIPDGEHVWRIWVEHALVFCAKDTDKIVGVLVAFPCASGMYCLHKVFVDPHHRGKRIGTRLAQELLPELDRMKVDCFLTVDPANSAAVRLYEQWGFTERRFVKGYYRDDEDRYVLTRRFQRPGSARGRKIT